VAIIISQGIASKLKTKHGVAKNEVLECFENRDGRLLIDTRQAHKDPTTYWFIAETHHRRQLKVCFVVEGDDFFLRTAYEPNAEERRIYNKFGRS
jgi:hypothetical protein